MREPAQNTVALLVRSASGQSFRRGGIAFSRLPVSVPLSSITAAQAVAILNEPSLVVEEVLSQIVAPIAAGPAPSESSPSPEPSTPPAPEPIHSGEGSAIAVTVDNAVASPEALAAKIAAALPPPAEWQAEVEAIRAEFATPSAPEPPLEPEPPAPPAPEPTPTRRSKRRR